MPLEAGNVECLKKSELEWEGRLPVVDLSLKTML